MISGIEKNATFQEHNKSDFELLLFKLVVVHAGCFVSFFKMFCCRCQALYQKNITDITAPGSV